VTVSTTQYRPGATPVMLHVPLPAVVHFFAGLVIGSALPPALMLPPNGETSV
jgi:hypothetical protein